VSKSCSSDAVPSIDAAAPDQTLPCNFPCPKCGSQDIVRTYREKWATWQSKEFGEYRSKYVSVSSYRVAATREHIEHHCRCCQCDWQTLPLAKPRAKRSEGAAASMRTSDILSTTETPTK
jgi:predicted RNA-binding Zn-ribbon protein involved in translation (DUF1610 family)